jgi:hypothetical protein
MSSPTLRNIVLVIFLLALIPLVGIPIYNKQKELSSEVSEYQELLNAVNTEIDRGSEDIYDKYMASVLGTYDQRIPRDKYIQSQLEDIDDIVDEYDSSSLDMVESVVSLPKIGKSLSFDLGNGSKVEVDSSGSLVYMGSVVLDIFVVDGRYSLFVFDDSVLEFPMVVVGSSKDEFVVLVLVDNQLVEYGRVLSNVNLGIYMDSGREYVLTYIDNSSLDGTEVSLWLIDHIKRDIFIKERVLEVGG